VIEMLGPAATGMNLIVWLDGDDEEPTPCKMHDKLQLADLETMFGKATVYLANKNLQKMPHRPKGAVVWLQDLNLIGLIMTSYGVHAHIKVLHPHSKFGNSVVVSNISQKAKIL
jgi:hypothetical protein